MSNLSQDELDAIEVKRVAWVRSIKTEAMNEAIRKRDLELATRLREDIKRDEEYHTTGRTSSKRS